MFTNKGLMKEILPYSYDGRGKNEEVLYAPTWKDLRNALLSTINEARSPDVW